MSTWWWRWTVSKATPKMNGLNIAGIPGQEMIEIHVVYYILLKGASQAEQGMSIKSVFAVESPLRTRDRSH